MLPHFHFCQYLENGYFSMRCQSVIPYAFDKRRKTQQMHLALRSFQMRRY